MYRFNRRSERKNLRTVVAVAGAPEGKRIVIGFVIGLKWGGKKAAHTQTQSATAAKKRRKKAS